MTISDSPPPYKPPTVREQIIAHMAATALLPPDEAFRAATAAYDKMKVGDLQVVEMNMRAKQTVSHSFDYDPYGNG